MRKKLSLLLVLTATTVFLCKESRAQNDACTSYRALVQKLVGAGCGLIWRWDDFPNPNLPPNTVCCQVTTSFDGLECITPVAKASCPTPVNSAGSICLKCLLAGQPIDLSTGNTFISESDLSVPGLGGGLQLTRTWNSMLPTDQSAPSFTFGQGWRSNFEERLLFAPGDGYLHYLRGDGSVWYFGVFNVGPPNVFKVSAPATDTTTTLTKGSPSWTLVFKNGEKRLFDATSGVLTAIADRNGNTLALSYDTAGRLATVTDAAQRHLYFNYPDNSSPLVSSVTSDVGITLSYTYDTQGRLSQMTKPDNTTISFQYDTNSNITAVLDADSKVLESHTYDALRRGLTSSRVNGVEHVTVSYPQ